MKEEWKDIENYEGYYQVSSNGQVRNKKTFQILQGDVNSVGYKRVCLYSPVKKKFFIHRLVAQYFCEGYKEGLVVNHKDGNKQNNVYTNLEWVTRSENDLHAFKMNLRKPNPCKFKHKIAVYDKDTENLIKIYNNIQECSDDLHIERYNIYPCCKGKQSYSKGYIFKYYNEK